MNLKTRQSKPSAKSQTKPASILVIEASAGDWQQHGVQLKAAGFKRHTVALGPQASKYLESGDFDLVLIDGSAAATEAQNFLARIRKTRAISELPVIMVTASDDTGETVRAFENGANDCVALPLDSPVLIARMRAQIASNSRPSRQSKANPVARGSVDWLELIMDSATIAIFETGPDGVINRLNVAASNLTGLESGSLIGKTLGSLFSGTSDNEISALLGRVAADGYFVSNHPARLRDSAGEERVLNLSLRRVGDDSYASGVVATAEDVTETWHRRDGAVPAPLPHKTAFPENEETVDHTGLKKPEIVVGYQHPKEAQSKTEATEANNRAAARHKVFKGGKLSFNNDSSLMDCVVRDISDSGAKLVFENFFDCPRLVRLRISDGQAYDCEVRWFANKIMGVNFLAPFETQT